MFRGPCSKRGCLGALQFKTCFTVSFILALAIIVFLLSRRGERLHAALKVVVVEEHHDVIPHWHQVVGRLSVLHVDAHEDTAAPPLAGYRQSMSGNDVFVVGAALSGKVTSFSWVWPSWDVMGPRHGGASDSDVHAGSAINSGLFYMKVGVIQTEKASGKVAQLVCACMYRKESDHVVDCEVGDEDYEETLLESVAHIQGRMLSRKMVVRAIESKCQFRVTLPTQHISDLEMLQGRYKSPWVRDPHQALVLDIDEDFFGVQSREDRKQTLGALPIDLLISAQEALKHIMIKTVAAESVTNDLLRQELDRAWRKCWAQPSIRPQCDAARHMFSTDARLYLVSLSSEEVVNDLDRTLLGLVRSSPNAAHLINAYGFCLRGSPNTYRDPSGGFLGMNQRRVVSGVKFCAVLPSPRALVNNDESPVSRACSNNPYEMKRRLAVLEEVLKMQPRKPVLVTICRSLRDGYTDPRHWAQIESGILEILERLYGSLDLLYDPHLLGGSGGWNTHTRVIKENPTPRFL